MSPTKRIKKKRKGGRDGEKEMKKGRKEGKEGWKEGR